MINVSELDLCFDILISNRYVDDEQYNTMTTILNNYKTKIHDKKVIIMMNTTLNIIQTEDISKDIKQIIKFKKPIMHSINKYIKEQEDKNCDNIKTIKLSNNKLTESELEAVTYIQNQTDHFFDFVIDKNKDNVSNDVLAKAMEIRIIRLNMLHDKENNQHKIDLLKIELQNRKEERIHEADMSDKEYKLKQLYCKHIDKEIQLCETKRDVVYANSKNHKSAAKKGEIVDL
jgi:hypothetical protein